MEHTEQHSAPNVENKDGRSSGELSAIQLERLLALEQQLEQILQRLEEIEDLAAARLDLNYSDLHERLMALERIQHSDPAAR